MEGEIHEEAKNIKGNMVPKHSEFLSDDDSSDTSSSSDHEYRSIDGDRINSTLDDETEKNSQSRNDTEPKPKGKYFRNLFIKNFGDDLDSCELRKMFQKFGFISSAVVETDEDGKSKGFGFVCFESFASAKLAVDEMNGMELNGKRIFVGRFLTKSERRKELMNEKMQGMKSLAKGFQGTNVYVKNLNDKTDDEELQKLFEPFGTVTSAKIMREENGKSKGFGFVNFSKPEEATKAISKRNGYLFQGRPLYASLAQKKQERRMILEERRLQKEIDKLPAKEMQRTNVFFTRPPQMICSEIPGNVVVNNIRQAYPSGKYSHMPPHLSSPTLIAGVPPVPQRLPLSLQPPMPMRNGIPLLQHPWRAEFTPPFMAVAAQGCGQNNFRSSSLSSRHRTGGATRRSCDSLLSEIHNSRGRRNDLSGEEDSKGQKDQKLSHEKQKEKREERRRRKRDAKIPLEESWNENQMKPKSHRNRPKCKERSKPLNFRDTKNDENLDECKEKFYGRKPVQVKRFPTYLQPDSDNEDNMTRKTEPHPVSSLELKESITEKETILNDQGEVFESTSSSDTDFEVKSAFICGENVVIESSKGMSAKVYPKKSVDQKLKYTGKKGSVASESNNPVHLSNDQIVREKRDDDDCEDPKCFLKIVAGQKKKAKPPVAARIAGMMAARIAGMKT